MEPKELLHYLYKDDKKTVEHFRESYYHLIEEEVLSRGPRWLSPEEVFDIFIRLASVRDLSRSPLTIKQMVQLIVDDLAKSYKPDEYLSEGILRLRAESFLNPSYELFVDTERILTPEYLSSHVAPYLNALAVVEHTHDKIISEPEHEVVIRFISQKSPFTVDLGGAAQAVNALKEDIVPWRKKNAQRVAELMAKEAEAEIRKIEAEAKQIRATSAKDRAEAEKLKAEAEKIRLENERQKVEIDKLKFELESAKLQLSLDIVSKMQPDLPDNEKLMYALKMLPAIGTLATSEIEPVVQPIYIPGTESL